MRRTFIAAACAVAVMSASVATAKQFPIKPIELIVPFAPSGATDLVARQIAEKMGQSLGQPVIVTNRAGASGAIGSDYVAKAAPDGYTLLVGVTTTHGINPVINLKLNYDPVKDFTPISLVATMPHVLLVNPKSPAKTLDDFIRLAKQASPTLAFGSAGEGSPQHLAGEMMKSRFGFDAVHVPYKGGGPALVDLVGGQIQFMSSGLSEAMPLMTSGRLRGIAVASKERVAGLDLPTFAESGHPLELTAWYAFFGPAGIPPEVTARLSAAIVDATKSQDVRAAFEKLHVTPVGSSSAELGAYVKAQLAQWAEAVKTAGIQPQK